MTIQVALRPVADSDLPFLFANQQDPVATAMAAFPTRDREAFWAHLSKIRADKAVTLRTVLVGSEVAGTINSWPQDGRAMVGYWIGRAFWGRGVATEALRLLLREVKERPLYAHVAKQNVGSVRVLEKCGFKIVGEEKDVSVGGGPPADEWVMRLDGP